MHLKLNIECCTLVQFMCVDHAVGQNTLVLIAHVCVRIRAQFDPVDEVDVQWGALLYWYSSTQWMSSGGLSVGASYSSD